MAWCRIHNLAVLFLAFVFAACGGDSGSNVPNNNVTSGTQTTQSGTSMVPTSQENLNYSGMTYKTYAGLVAEQPCELSLNFAVAHVSSTNEDYLCSEDASTGVWSWQPYQGGAGADMGENGRIYETFVDSRDGHVYKMVTIGLQTWMAENLDFASDGSSCYVNPKTGLDECGLYSRGRFYLWSVAVDSAGIYSNNAKGCGSSVGKNVVYGEDCTPIYPMRGVCPQGWHLPDTTEWRTLFNYTGCNYPKCDLLIKDKDNLDASDAYGFSALRLSYMDGKIISEGTAADFWTSTIIWSNKNTLGLHYTDIYDNVSPGLYTDGGTFSSRIKRPVRCIKNTGESQQKITSSSSGMIRSSSSLVSRSSSSIENGSYVCGDLWCGRNLDYDIKLGNGTYGSWFDYVTDDGWARVTFPVAKSTSMEPVVDACKGICGHYEVVDVFSSVAGVGFYVSEDGKTAKNITSWNGICVSYKSDKPIQLRISYDDDWTPQVMLPASITVVTKDFLWNQFAQPTWTPADVEKISGDEAAKKAVSIKFEFATQGEGDFAIYSVGKSGSCK